MGKSDTTSIDDAKVICPNCEANYDRLPAYTCPRCGTPLCKTGCDGCTKKCACAKKTHK